jgi:hypothetical protein
MAGRDVLFNGANRACESLSCRTALILPKIATIKVEPSPTQIETAIKDLQSNGLVLAGIEPNYGINNAVDICTVTEATNIPLAIAEQAVGNLSGRLKAGDLLSLLSKGTEAIFTEYDFIADDAVLSLIVEHMRSAVRGAIIIGDPAKRVKGLIDEIQLDWNDPEVGPIYRPDFTFRLACALTRVLDLRQTPYSREKIALELIRGGWFAYNFDDTRKAVGALATIWNLDNKRLHLLPQEARRRGFPDPSNADVLFQLIDMIDKRERLYTSASGNKFDLLYISEI